MKSGTLLAAVLFISACIPVYKISDPVRLSHNFNKSYDNVWQEAVKMIAREGYLITATDKSSGLISYVVRLNGDQVTSYAAESSPSGTGFRRGSATLQVLIEPESDQQTRATVFARLSGVYIDFWSGQERVADLNSRGVLENEFFTKISTALGEKTFAFLGPSAPQAQSTSPPPMVAAGLPSLPKNQIVPPQPVSPTPIRRNAMLNLFKGPQIMSGVTLRAEFYDNGVDGGHARVFYGNIIFDGPFVRLESGQHPTLKLIDGKAISGLQLRSDRPHSFGFFRETSGQFLECYFGVSRVTDQDTGICKDSTGNHFWLVFMRD